MKTKEESSFLQGVESRLDSLFAEDPQSSKEKDSEPIQMTTAKVAAGRADDTTEDIREPQQIKDSNRSAEVSSEPSQAPDKSAFISEIEKRFSAIFGEDDKEEGPVKEKDKPADDLKEVISPAGREESNVISPLLEDISSPPSSILLSPLKDMKSIILSIEWEINDSILEQLEDEINKLYLLYTGDRIIQGFLRILRFLGRYIRVRGVRSNQDSINLLLFVYDHLENVMVSDGMTEAKKNVILLDNIKKYRAWVESTDLEIVEEKQVPETMDLSEAPPWEKISIEDIKEDVQPLSQALEVNTFEDKAASGSFIDTVSDEAKQPVTGRPLPEEEPFTGVLGEKAGDEELFVQKPREIFLETAEKTSNIIQSEQAATASDLLHETREDVREALSGLKELPPHEAFTTALEEIKKNFREELDALKEEIRILKSAR